MMNQCWRTVGVAGAVALAAPSIDAQSVRTGPAVQRALRDTTLVRQIPGRWKKGAVFSRVDDKTQSATMLASLSHVAELLHSALGTLPGVEADASWNADAADMAGGGHVIGGQVRVLLWPYVVRNGTITVYNNAAVALFQVNHTACVGDDAVAKGLGFMLAPRHVERSHGFPMFDSTIVITHRAQPPCIPVSRGEIIQALARQIAAAVPAGDSLLRAELSKREQALPELDRSNPSLAAMARTQIANLKEALRRTDSTGTASRRTYADALGRMSPAERASPAYLTGTWCSNDSDPLACFVNPGTPNARAVVRENPAFFDRTRPTDVQLITLSAEPRYPANPGAGYPMTLLNAALDRLDWNALSAMLH